MRSPTTKNVARDWLCSVAKIKKALRAIYLMMVGAPGLEPGTR